MNKYKLLSLILVVLLLVLGCVTFVLGRHISSLNSKKSDTSAVSANIANDIPNEYLKSNYRVIGSFRNNSSYSKTNTPDMFINQVQLEVATIRQGNPSDCGSLIMGGQVERTCYFFLEPLDGGVNTKTTYLGRLPADAGQFIPSSIKFVAPDNVEFNTDSGENGCGQKKLWELNLHTGNFLQLRNVQHGC